MFDSIVESVCHEFRKSLEHYITVEEILTIFDRITSQMDYAQKITGRKQSVLSTTHTMTQILPPYNLPYNEKMYIRYQIREYCTLLK
jgi:hypothetical protein